MVHLLQVCNVGRIVGGTAACAWTVTRSLPRFRHTVAFLGSVTEETRRVFAPARVENWEQVTAARVERVDPDIVLLHNTGRGRVAGALPRVCVQYLHSRIDPAPADRALYCSRWLARQYGAGDGAVCWQGVPRPGRDASGPDTRALRDTLVVGRLCTPQAKKWPADVVPFYRRLAEWSPEVQWEFVGCPEALVEPLRAACGGRVEFLPAGWEARRRLWHWDALLYHNAEVTESFGRTAAEAMRAGCVPVVDRRGGFVEQVAVGTGFLCETMNEFEGAVEALRDAGERRRRSRACRAHADEWFSLGRFGAELVGRFREVAGC